jgi:hypothetical protein
MTNTDPADAARPAPQPARALIAREVRRLYKAAFDPSNTDAAADKRKLGQLIETLIDAVPDDWTDPLADLREDIYGPYTEQS